MDLNYSAGLRRWATGGRSRGRQSRQPLFMGFKATPIAGPLSSCARSRQSMRRGCRRGPWRKAGGPEKGSGWRIVEGRPTYTGESALKRGSGARDARGVWSRLVLSNWLSRESPAGEPSEGPALPRFFRVAYGRSEV